MASTLLAETPWINHREEEKWEYLSYSGSGEVLSDPDRQVRQPYSACSHGPLDCARILSISKRRNQYSTRPMDLIKRTAVTGRV
ncbi:hypothetical protein J6590_066080 [Homalodisca vitripennis]|nr:hypothetical protein J6590_066080 [Homalodisca vitripennis]